MAEAERTPYERTEDTGQSTAQSAESQAAPGAGARKSDKADEEETPRRHERVVSGAEGGPGLPSDSILLGNPTDNINTEESSEEEFRQAIQELHKERARVDEEEE